MKLNKEQEAQFNREVRKACQINTGTYPYYGFSKSNSRENQLARANLLLLKYSGKGNRVYKAFDAADHDEAIHLSEDALAELQADQAEYNALLRELWK